MRWRSSCNTSRRRWGGTRAAGDATCARAGAEDDLVLIWCLVAASSVAYILQEESGRLTMVSGSSFGHALRVKFAPDHSSHAVPAVRSSLLTERGSSLSLLVHSDRPLRARG